MWRPPGSRTVRSWSPAMTSGLAVLGLSRVPVVSRPSPWRLTGGRSRHVHVADRFRSLTIASLVRLGVATSGRGRPRGRAPLPHPPLRSRAAPARSRRPPSRHRCDRSLSRHAPAASAPLWPMSPPRHAASQKFVACAVRLARDRVGWRWRSRMPTRGVTAADVGAPHRRTASKLHIYKPHGFLFMMERRPTAPRRDPLRRIRLQSRRRSQPRSRRPQIIEEPRWVPDGIPRHLDGRLANHSG